MLYGLMWSDAIWRLLSGSLEHSGRRLREPRSLCRGRARESDRVERPCVPPAAERLNEQHARRESPAEDIDGVALVVERDGLRRDHVDVAHDAGLVLVGGELHGLPRALHRLVQQLRLLCKEPERREVVLDLLE